MFDALDSRIEFHRVLVLVRTMLNSVNSHHEEFVGESKGDFEWSLRDDGQRRAKRLLILVLVPLVDVRTGQQVLRWQRYIENDRSFRCLAVEEVNCEITLRISKSHRVQDNHLSFGQRSRGVIGEGERTFSHVLSRIRRWIGCDMICPADVFHVLEDLKHFHTIQRHPEEKVAIVLAIQGDMESIVIDENNDGEVLACS